jgi:gluconokinase
MIVILMGVTGSGKTTVGMALAAQLRWIFVDGDDFHSAENKSKMHAGIPLTDQDRAPWLAALHTQISIWAAENPPADAILACSALKQQYRDTLTSGIDPNMLRVVWLEGPATTIQDRLTHRSGHFMSPTLLSSQMATLEIPANALRVSIDQIVPQILQQIIAGLDLAADATSPQAATHSPDSLPHS